MCKYAASESILDFGCSTRHHDISLCHLSKYRASGTDHSADAVATEGGQGLWPVRRAQLEDFGYLVALELTIHFFYEIKHLKLKLG